MSVIREVSEKRLRQGEAARRLSLYPAGQAGAGSWVFRGWCHRGRRRTTRFGAALPGFRSDLRVREKIKLSAECAAGIATGCMCKREPSPPGVSGRSGSDRRFAARLVRGEGPAVGLDDATMGFWFMAPGGLRAAGRTTRTATACLNRAGPGRRVDAVWAGAGDAGHRADTPAVRRPKRANLCRTMRLRGIGGMPTCRRTWRLQPAFRVAPRNPADAHRAVLHDDRELAILCEQHTRNDEEPVAPLRGRYLASHGSRQGLR